MTTLKRGFSPKKDKNVKTIYEIEFANPTEGLHYFTSEFNNENCLQWLWAGYSIYVINSGARAVEAKKGDPLKYIEDICYNRFPTRSTVTHNVPKLSATDQAIKVITNAMAKDSAFAERLKIILAQSCSKNKD